MSKKGLEPSKSLEPIDKRPQIKFKGHRRAQLRIAQIELNSDRAKFWAYCVRAALGARERVKRKGLPFAIDAHFLDRMLVDQKWCCAVSGAPLKPPSGDHKKHYKDPFGPSLDRIVPSQGYVPGNVRLVANIVNVAMNEWGLTNLLKLVDFMAERHNTVQTLLDEGSTEIDRLRAALAAKNKLHKTSINYGKALRSQLAALRAKNRDGPPPPPRDPDQPGTL